MNPSRIATIALILLAAGTTLAQDRQIELSTAQQERAGILTERVRERSFGQSLRVFGEVTRAPASTIVVRTNLHGHIETVNVEPGDRVDAAQLLVEMHSHELQERKATLLEAYQAIRLAESRLEAGQQLLEVEGISELEVRRREQELLSSRLHARNLEVTLEEHGVPHEEIEELRQGSDPTPVVLIRAPVAGVVLDVHVHPAAWTQELEPLVVIGTDQTVELLLQVPPEHAEGLKVGDPLQFRTVGEGGPDREARVLKRLPQVDPLNRSVPVRAALNGGSNGLFPGALVEATLVVGSSAAGPAVHADAVTRVDGREHVFIRTGADTFVAREVMLGVFDGEYYEVQSGLAEGDEVVVAGTFLLKSALVRGDG